MPAYALVLVLAVAVASAILIAGAKRFGLGRSAAARFLLLALLLGLFFARLVYSAVRYDFLFFDAMDGRFLGIAPFLDISKGSLSMFGMLLGVFLAAVLDARLARNKTTNRLDAIALPLAAFIAIARFGEILAGQGYGGAVETEWLRFFPLSIQDPYGDWLTAVFVLEGLTALGIAGWLMILRRRKYAQLVNHYLNLMIPLCASQVFLESLRRDDYLRLESNGFVRVSQVLALVFLIAIVAYLTHRSVREGKGWQQPVISWLVLVLAALAALAAEFYEKLPVPMPLLYGVSFAAQLLLIVVLLRHTRRITQVSHLTA